MSGYEVDREWLDAWLARTRAEQGLPRHVEDPVILASAAALVLPYFKAKGLMDQRASRRRTA